MIMPYFYIGRRDYLCGSNNHVSPLKAESFPWLISEEVREITSIRKTWCTVPGLQGLCGEKCGWFLEAEHSPSWQPAGKWLLQPYNCKALSPTSSRNELEINLSFRWENRASRYCHFSLSREPSHTIPGFCPTELWYNEWVLWYTAKYENLFFQQ